MAVDMRSNETDELLKLEARLLDLVKQAVADENARWNNDKISVEIKLIGDRPAGIVSMDSPIVQATQRTVIEGRECVRERCGQSASRAGKARVLSA